MRRWHTCFFILLFCGFSGNVLCKESINEAIERLYQPLTSNDDIPITDEFSLDLRSNMSATPGKMTPWLNNNLLCRCVDDAFVSAEIIQSRLVLWEEGLCGYPNMPSEALPGHPASGPIFQCVSQFRASAPHRWYKFGPKSVCSWS